MAKNTPVKPTAKKSGQIVHSESKRSKINFGNVKNAIFKISGKVFSYRPKTYTPVLATLLVIAAFLLGVLITKVQYLENGTGTNNIVAQNDQTGTTTGNTQPPTVGQKVDVAVGNFPAQGDKNAKIKIIEFADFRCPFCEQFYKESESQIINDYVKTGKAVYYFRHFAFLGPASVVAANAAECANEQNKFWEMHKYLFDNQPPESDTSMYTVDKMTEAAGTLGINTDQFRSCLSANKYQANVDKDQKEGQTAGVSGTPTIFINGVPLVGAEPYTTIKAQIDQELSK